MCSWQRFIFILQAVFFTLVSISFAAMQLYNSISQFSGLFTVLLEFFQNIYCCDFDILLALLPILKKFLCPVSYTKSFIHIYKVICPYFYGILINIKGHLSG